MKKRTALLVLMSAASIVGSIGCQGYSRPFRFPGTIQQQQFQATVHDPYPDNDLGPEVVGVRPREFQQPAPEPVRSRSFWDNLWGR